MSIKPGFGKSCKFTHLGLLSLAPMAGTKSTTSYWAFMTMLIVLVSRVQTGLNVLYYNKHLQTFRAQTDNYLNKNTHLRGSSSRILHYFSPILKKPTLHIFHLIQLRRNGPYKTQNSVVTNITAITWSSTLCQQSRTIRLGRCTEP